MKVFLMRLFAMRGTWEWALRQMGKGKIVRRRSLAGSGRYKFDSEGQGRLMWTHYRRPRTEGDWCESSDFPAKNTTATDWEVCG